MQKKVIDSVNDYLKEKREAYLMLTAYARKVAAEKGSEATSTKLVTKGRICGRSGVREVIDGDGFHYVTDTGAVWNGNNVGPNAPTCFIATLNSCIMHTAAVIAAEQEIDMDYCTCEMTADYYPVGGYRGFEDLPKGPQNIQFVLTVDSTESEERLAQFLKDIESRCPIGSLLKVPPKGTLINKHGKEA